MSLSILGTCRRVDRHVCRLTVALPGQGWWGSREILCSLTKKRSCLIVSFFLVFPAWVPSLDKAFSHTLLSRLTRLNPFFHWHSAHSISNLFMSFFWGILYLILEVAVSRRCEYTSYTLIVSCDFLLLVLQCTRSLLKIPPRIIARKAAWIY